MFERLRSEMAHFKHHEPKRRIKTDWWSGRQEADALEVLRSSVAQKHLKSIKDLPVEAGKVYNGD